VDDAEQGDVPMPQDWRVRTSARVKNLKIQVFPHGGVEVVAPPRTRPKIIAAFVAEHSDWISNTRRQFAELRPPEPTLPDSIHLQACNETVSIHFAVAEHISCREQHGILSITAPVLEGKVCWPLLQNWLKQRAKQYLPELCFETGHKLGLEPAKVYIRLQKTRWGSCSTKGNINLNAALLLRPKEEVHYVIIHELCHLRHMNHSKRYWQLVSQHVPDWKAIDQRLDRAWQISPNWLIG
jgi:predicted metal-dependent hydrolase